MLRFVRTPVKTPGSSCGCQPDTGSEAGLTLRTLLTYFE